MTNALKQGNCLIIMTHGFHLKVKYISAISAIFWKVHVISLISAITHWALKTIYVKLTNELWGPHSASRGGIKQCCIYLENKETKEKWDGQQTHVNQKGFGGFIWRHHVGMIMTILDPKGQRFILTPACLAKLIIPVTPKTYH